MPAEVHNLAEKLKSHPDVKNPYALATAIVEKRKRIRATRARQIEEKREEGHGEG